MILPRWNLAVNTIEAFPLILGGAIIFGLSGVALIVLGTIKNKIRKRFHHAKEINDAEKMFLIETEYKEFGKKEVIIMTSAIPYVLLTAIIYIMFLAFKKGTLKGVALVFCIFAIAFLGFIAIGLPISLFKQSSSNKKKSEKLTGHLQKIILSTYIESDNNSVRTEEYRLMLTYKWQGEEFELLTDETFSKEQLNVLKQLDHIPLIRKGNIVKVDQNQIFKTSRQSYSSEVEIEKGVVASYGYNKEKGKENSAIRDIRENIYNINERQSLKKSFNIVFTILVALFCAVFAGFGVVAMVYREYSGIVFVIAAAIFFYLGVIKTIVDTKRYNKVRANGRKDYALNYKLKGYSSDDSGRNRYGIEFYFNDEQGNERKARETYIKVSPFYFESYQIDRLPIRVYDKYAIVDYDELLKHKENKEVK